MEENDVKDCRGRRARGEGTHTIERTSDPPALPSSCVCRPNVQYALGDASSHTRSRYSPGGEGERQKAEVACARACSASKLGASFVGCLSLSRISPSYIGLHPHLDLEVTRTIGGSIPRVIQIRSSQQERRQREKNHAVIARGTSTLRSPTPAQPNQSVALAPIQMKATRPMLEMAVRPTTTHPVYVTSLTERTGE